MTLPDEVAPTPSDATVAPRAATLFTLGGALAVISVVFRRALAGEVLFRRDVHLMWYTQTEAMVKAIGAREWPLWNPDIGFGQPLWADANTQILYPPTWLNLLLRPWTYYTVFVVGHLLAAAFGVRTLGRALGLRPLAGVAAALLWVASGPLLSLGEVWNQLAGAAWMPWALLAAIHALQTGNPKWALAWGACLAAQVLAGSPEAVLLGGAGGLAYAAVARQWRRDGPRAWARAAAMATLAVLVALGLSAAQWLPALAAAAESGRAELAAAAQGYWSLDPRGMAQMVLPLAADTPRLRPELAAALYGGRDPLLPSLYLGLATVPLALAALASRRRRAAVWLIAALAGCVAVALGPHLPLQPLFTTLLPPLRALRYPIKAMTAAGLVWALLCGLGAEAWSQVGPRWDRRSASVVLVPAVLLATVSALGAIALARWPEAIGPWVLAEGSASDFARMLASARNALSIGAVAGLVTTILALARDRSPGRAPTLAAAAVAVAVIDLTIAHARLVPTAPRALFTYRPSSVVAAQPPDHGRLYSYDYFTPGRSAAYLSRLQPFAITRAPQDWPAPAATALAMRLSLFPPTPAPWGIPGSFDQDTPGIAPRRSALLRDVLLGLEGTPSLARLLATGAVSRMVALHDRGLEGLPLLATADALLPEALRIRAVPGAVPRAHAVGRALVIPDDAAALRALLDPAFDPSREVVLAEPDGPAGGGTPALRSVVRIDRIGADRMRLQADLSAAGYVVLADAWTRGWTARVDGMARRVLRANVGFRAVAVPAGRHEVELRYRPPGLDVGLGITGTTAALFAIALALIRRRGQRLSPA